MSDTLAIICGLIFIFLIIGLYIYLRDLSYDFFNYLKSIMKSPRKTKITFDKLYLKFDPKYNIKIKKPFIITMFSKNLKDIHDIELNQIKSGDQLILIPDFKKKHKHNNYVCTKTGSIIGVLMEPSWYDQIYSNLTKGKRWDAFVKEVRKPINDAVIELWEYVDEEEISSHEAGLLDLLIYFFRKNHRLGDCSYVPQDTLHWTSSENAPYNIQKLGPGEKAKDIFNDFLKYGFESKGKFFDHLNNLKNIKDLSCYYTNNKVNTYDSYNNEKHYKEGAIEYTFNTPSGYNIIFYLLTDYGRCGSDFYNLNQSFYRYFNFGRTRKDLVVALMKKDLVPFETWEERENKRNKAAEEFRESFY